MTNNKSFDQKHLWHPYSDILNPGKITKIISANGVKLKLENGKELIDGMSSWWSAIHGYNHPTLNLAATNQLNKMSHIMFGGITHDPAIEFGKLLIEITPTALEKIFFADSGSVAVEVALKMALQFWISNNKPKKNKFLSLLNGYHGDTFGAMSVTDPINGMHSIFNNMLPKHYFAPSPSCKFNTACTEGDIQQIKTILIKNHTTIAAVIVEPIVQGAGGMIFYSADYLYKLKQLCEEYNVLLIADEIATGFARTGELFACNHANICPDIMCLGKAITGGYLTLAATICTNKVAKGISNGSANILMHGPTFMANPLALSIAIASANILLKQDYKQNIKRIEQIISKGLQPALNFSHVVDVRVLGAIGVIELYQEVDQDLMQQLFVQEGVWVRPFRKLIYIMPPYIISNAELEFLTEKIILILSKLS